MSNAHEHLTDFIPAATLQRVVDSFAAVTGYAAVIHDAEGAVLAESAQHPPALAQDEALQQTLREHGARTPPLVSLQADGRRLGSIGLSHRAVRAAGEAPAAASGEAEPARQGKFRGRVSVAEAEPVARRAEVVQFLYLIGDTISQMCRQGSQLRHRVRELTTLFELSTLLAEQRDLRRVLDTVVENLVRLMGVKAAAIRLLDEAGVELRVAAVHNLSSRYLEKGPILVADSRLDQAVLSGEVVYVEDMAHDPRVIYQDDAQREGLASILCSGMIYRGRPIGVVRLYTGKIRRFGEDERRYLQAIAQLAAAAVRNAQLDAKRLENERIEQQVRLAADVQRRLLPQANPVCPPYEVAGRYEPCFELGGDFYDFIPLDSSLGVLVGDVVGKGVAASLLMASVRASFRAHAQDIYDLDEIMSMVNRALAHDSRAHEFATVFYGTLDRHTCRLTYCSAGHEPGLLLREGRFTELSTGGMALGIDADQRYEKILLELRAGDVIVLYSDGATDASNFAGEKFGRERVREAVAAKAAGSAVEIVNHVVWEVRRFAGLNKRPDDITVVAVKVTAAGCGGVLPGPYQP